MKKKPIQNHILKEWVWCMFTDNISYKDIAERTTLSYYTICYAFSSKKATTRVQVLIHTTLIQSKEMQIK
jgi:hypothetical protein